MERSWIVLLAQWYFLCWGGQLYIESALWSPQQLYIARSLFKTESKYTVANVRHLRQWNTCAKLENASSNINGILFTQTIIGSPMSIVRCSVRCSKRNFANHECKHMFYCVTQHMRINRGMVNFWLSLICIDIIRQKQSNVTEAHIVCVSHWDTSPQ